MENPNPTECVNSVIWSQVTKKLYLGRLKSNQNLTPLHKLCYLFLEETRNAVCFRVEWVNFYLSCASVFAEKISAGLWRQNLRSGDSGSLFF
ncbi:hypothetical protein CEXT_675741 [Caerostris extrusa]|uniref:Uncharacterized protein n=1 Tax=Caerostris extrusa TaxID=172846 RepID=A0AAV4PSP5_CAEEX|nr:hypothetical protein CEXT_675741 [Caerostris extrusa]